jgi:hypothetical protein
MIKEIQENAADQPGGESLNSINSQAPTRCIARGLSLLLVASSILISGVAGLGAANDATESRTVADSLAKMLQSARAVISKHQDDINDPKRADKGLTAAVVLAEADANYKAATGTDPASYDPATRQGRMLKAQRDAIVEVINDNQAIINREGLGFKGFIPATFARLVNEAFARKVEGGATIKVTAPPELVRNRKARPDEWEVDVIKTRFLKPDWKAGTPYAETVEVKGKPAFRMMVPEYYAASCLSCHGTPKGTLDITGYPREGAAEHDLGGVISVILPNE